MINCPACGKQFEYDGNLTPEELLLCPYCNAAAMVFETVVPGVGIEIGGFRLLKSLGHGGMGNVYLAEQISIGRKVAVKILPGELIQDKKSTAMFMKEIKTTARLEHPAIVGAIDAGIDRGVHYFAMSYVEGKDLESYLRDHGSLDESRAIKYMIRIAEALEYAWETHRLLHRDIKPGNIIINGDDEAFLLDMGIAQHFSETFERRELIDGSPYYMSPEQTFGEPLGWASDLYSLGAGMYHLLTGVPPYDSDDIDQIMKMHSSEPFPDPAVSAPGIKLSRGTVEMLSRMMEKNPANRFGSWREFILTARELHGKLLAGNTAGHLPVLPAEQDQETHPGREKMWVTVAGLSAVTVALAFSLLLIWKFTAEQQAGRDLRRAEALLQHDDCDYDEALGLFRAAEASCSSWLVGYEKLERARRGYAIAEERMIRELGRRGEFRRLAEAVGIMLGDVEAGRGLAGSRAWLDTAIERLKPVTEYERDKFNDLKRRIAALPPEEP